jgi:hypothetical protein
MISIERTRFLVDNNNFIQMTSLFASGARSKAVRVIELEQRPSIIPKWEPDWFSPFLRADECRAHTT